MQRLNPLRVGAVLLTTYPESEIIEMFKFQSPSRRGGPSYTISSTCSSVFRLSLNPLHIGAGLLTGDRDRFHGGRGFVSIPFM